MKTGLTVVVAAQRVTGGVRFQCFQRRGGAFNQRNVVFANRSQRLARVGAEFFRHVAQSIQYLILSARLRLLTIKQFTSRAALGTKAHDIAATKTLDRTRQHCLPADPFANLPRCLTGESGIRRLLHQLQRRADLRI